MVYLKNEQDDESFVMAPNISMSILNFITLDKIF